MNHKTFTRSRKIKDIEREVRRTYKKIIEDCERVEKKKLLFRAGG